VRRPAALLASVLLATACQTPAPLLPLSPDDPRPKALLDKWAETARQRRALRGLARLAVDGRDGEVGIRSRQLLVAERPARLRVEVLDFLHRTLAVLVTDGERFELFRADDRSLETGEVHPGLLWEVAHLALPPEQAVGLLLGAPRLDPDLAVAGARRSGEGEFQIDLADAAGRVRQRVAFDAEARLRWLEVREMDGGVAWRARFDDYAAVGASPFAHTVSLDLVREQTHAEISLRSVELNPRLNSEIFQLRIPGLERPEAEGAR
jgi:hypothetical protein